MLKNANPKYFTEIYIVCGYTDLRYGIDSLAVIIERRYRMDLFVPNILFLFCERAFTKIKGLRSMTPEQFKGLMQGFAIDPVIYDVPRIFCLIAFFVKNREIFPCFSLLKKCCVQL